MNSTKTVVWQILIPTFIFAITFATATCIQFFVFKSHSTFVSFIIKMILSGFISDLLTSIWITPSLLKTAEDKYSYNTIVEKWMSSHPNIKTRRIILIGLVYFFAISILISLLPKEEVIHNPLSDKTLAMASFFGLIVAPIIETTFNQLFVIESVKWITKRITGNDYVAFSGIVSAIIFGLMHNFSNMYIIYGFFLGLYFSFSYIYITTTYNSRFKGLLCTILLHFTINLFPFMAMVIEKLS